VAAYRTGDPQPPDGSPEDGSGRRPVDRTPERGAAGWPGPDEQQLSAAAVPDGGQADRRDPADQQGRATPGAPMDRWARPATDRDDDGQPPYTERPTIPPWFVSPAESRAPAGLDTGDQPDGESGYRPRRPPSDPAATDPAQQVQHRPDQGGSERSAPAPADEPTTRWPAQPGPRADAEPTADRRPSPTPRPTPAPVEPADAPATAEAAPPVRRGVDPDYYGDQQRPDDDYDTRHFSYDDERADRPGGELLRAVSRVSSARRREERLEQVETGPAAHPDTADGGSGPGAGRALGAAAAGVAAAGASSWFAAGTGRGDSGAGTRRPRENGEPADDNRRDRRRDPDDDRDPEDRGHRARDGQEPADRVRDDPDARQRTRNDRDAPDDRDPRDRTRNGRDTPDDRDPRDGRVSREGARDAREDRDTRDDRDTRADRDGRDRTRNGRDARDDREPAESGQRARDDREPRERSRDDRDREGRARRDDRDRDARGRREDRDQEDPDRRRDRDDDRPRDRDEDRRPRDPDGRAGDRATRRRPPDDEDRGERATRSRSEAAPDAPSRPRRPARDEDGGPTRRADRDDDRRPSDRDRRAAGDERPARRRTEGTSEAADGRSDEQRRRPSGDRPAQRRRSREPGDPDRTTTVDRSGIQRAAAAGAAAGAAAAGAAAGTARPGAKSKQAATKAGNAPPPATARKPGGKGKQRAAQRRSLAGRLHLPGARGGDAAEATTVLSATPEAGPGEQRTRRGPLKWLSRLPKPARIAVLAVVGLLVLVGVLGGGTSLLLNAKLHDVDALDPDSPVLVQPAAQAGDENYLVTTTDGTNNQAPPWAVGAGVETITLVHVPAAGGRVVMLSVPPTLAVDRGECPSWNSTDSSYPGGTVPGQRNSQLTAAYAKGGPKCLVMQVQALTGLLVNHFVSLNVTGLGGMVDAVGGVPLCQRQPVVDTALGTVASATSRTVTGSGALSLARAWHVTGEPADGTGQALRQQRLFAALLGQLAGSPLTRLPTTFTVAGAFAGAALVDGVHFGDLHELAGDLNGTDPSQIQFAAVPTKGAPDAQGNQTLSVDAAVAQFEALRTNRALPTSAPGAAAQSAPTGQIPVTIRNGSSKVGLANQAADGLRAAGFPVGQVSSTKRQPDGHTVIRASDDHMDQAAGLAKAIPSASVQRVPGSGDLELVVGDSFDGRIAASVTGGGASGQTGSGTLPVIHTAAEFACG
jgi:LCP family protein required for cell wall assembly